MGGGAVKGAVVNGGIIGIGNGNGRWSYERET